MTPIVYDGRTRAAEIKGEVKKNIATFKKETGITPTLTIIKVNRSIGTDLYTKMKEKAAEEVGAKVEIFDLGSPKKTYQDIIKMIRYVDSSPENHGVMVQLPFPKRLIGKRDYILDFIPSAKDIDGMRSDSNFTMPVTRAILDAVDIYKKEANKKGKLSILVIGYKGFVGGNIVNKLEKLGHKVKKVDRGASRRFSWENIRNKSEGVDLIITATGHAGLLHGKNVIDGVGVIDLGAPEPEVEYNSVKDKVSFITPVPGGIGPVTIAYLLENLYKAAYNQAR